MTRTTFATLALAAGTAASSQAAINIVVPNGSFETATTIPFGTGGTVEAPPGPELHDHLP